MKNVWWIYILIIGVFLSCSTETNKDNKVVSWQQQLDEQLPLLGHRNWILVVDKAFPMPTSNDCIIIDSKEPTLEVLNKVLLQINKQPHVKAVVYTDQELAYIKPDWVPEIDAFKSHLQAILGATQSNSIPHGNVLEQFDKSSQKFKTVIIKTEGLIAYSSVFIQLDCKYWSTAKEDSLRNAIRVNDTIS